MPISDWSDLLPSPVRIPIAVYKNRKFIQHWWTKLVTYVGLGKANIAILGRPSVGKSVLCSHLYGETTSLSFELPTTSDNVETKAIEIGSWTEVVKVIPGQTTHERALAMNELFKNKLDGIIYTVDWGYTNVRDTTIKQQLIDEGVDTIQKLRDYNLAAELEDLKLILSKIQDASSMKKGPKWIVIAVNKVDLFLDQLNLAQQYYHPNSKSNFTKILNETINNIGKQNIKCISLPISAWSDEFEWNGKIIKSQITDKATERNFSKNFINSIAKL